MIGRDRYWLQLFVLNGVVILALRIAPFRRVIALATRLADRLRTRRRIPHEQLIDLLRTHTQHIKSRSIFPGKCLSRSIALYAVLRRYGIDAEIRIGARSVRNTITAHAWVEIDGRPVNAGPAVRTRYHTYDYAFDQLS